MPAWALAALPALMLAASEFSSHLPIVVIDSFSRQLPSPDEDSIDASLLVCLLTRACCDPFDLATPACGLRHTLAMRATHRKLAESATAHGMSMCGCSSASRVQLIPAAADGEPTTLINHAGLEPRSVRCGCAGVIPARA